MVQLCRKFFLFGMIFIPLIACALPNFAALAPTVPASPAAERATLESELPPPTSLPAGNQLNPVPVPSAPEAISVLDPPPAVADLVLPETAELAAGIRYQISRSAVFVHEPPAGESVIYWLSDGADLSVRDASGGQPSNLIGGESDGATYAFLPQASEGPLQVNVAFDPSAENEFAILTVEDVTRSARSVVSQIGFYDGENLPRIEAQTTAGRTYAAILQSGGEFDGVLEYYGADGEIVSLDEFDAGGAEILIFSPAQSGESVFLVFGFQRSVGDFELTVFELPN